MTAPTLPVRRYQDFSAGRTVTRKLRDLARDGAIRVLSAGRSPNRGSGWIRFPFYHHVFDDEREDFRRQLDFMAGFGDFIGLDVLYSVCTSLFEEFKRDEYAPPPLMKRMVASGRLGRKSGQGFYEYSS